MKACFTDDDPFKIKKERKQMFRVKKYAEYNRITITYFIVRVL